MSSTMTGSAEQWGPLWGARAREWAAVEEQQLPTYEAAIERLGIGAGQRVLDIGCGSGVYLRAAADRGAEVAGLDASESLLEIARARVPEADLRSGDMQFLPYEDDTFDVVSGFNSFFFAGDMAAALREAGRVAKPGGTVLIQVWGRPERCDLEGMKRAVGRLLARDAAEPPPFWRPGVLEELASSAGLEPADSFDTRWAFEFADEEDAVRHLLAAGGSVAAVAAAGREPVEAALRDAVAPYRRPDGGYRLENEWHFLFTQIR
jgi:SAM-dependent methyltransferase